MTHDEIRNRLPLAALGQLDPDESHEVDTHVAHCAECQQDVNDYRMIHQSLSATAEDWDGHQALRQQFSQRLPRTTRHGSRRTVWGWAAAAVIALSGAGLFTALHHRNGPGTPLQSFMADSSSVVTLAHGGVFSRTKLYLKADRALVVPAKLPPLSPGHTYEGWWISGNRVKPAGTFGTRPTFLAIPAPRPQQFAVTIEPRGGTPKPTTAVIAAGNLPS